MEARKNLPERKKKQSREKTWQEIWVGSRAHTVKSYTAKATKATQQEGLCPHLLSMYFNKAW